MQNSNFLSSGVQWIMSLGELALGRLELLEEFPILDNENCNGILTWIEQNLLLKFFKNRTELVDKKHETAREVMFSVLGEDFLAKYYTELGLKSPLDHHPELLYEPYMNGLVRRELQDEYRKAIEEFLWSTLETNPSQVTDNKDLKNFQQKVRELVRMRLHLWETSDQYTRNHQQELISRAFKAALQGQGYEVGSCLPHAEHFMLSSHSLQQIQRKKEFQVEFYQPQDSRWHSFHSSLQDKVADLLKGRCLTLSLFRMLLLSQLYNENETITYRETISNNSHARVVAPGISTIHGMLQKMVDEAFGVELRMYDDVYGLVRKQAVQILNAFYVYNGSHSSSALYLVVPIIKTFSDLAVPLEVSVQMLHTLTKTVLASHDSSICENQARQVFQQLTKESPNLGKFIIRLYTEYRSSMARALVGAPIEQALKVQRTTPHTLFLPWLRNAMVGVVGQHALEFIWSQCVLFGWDQLLHFCVDIVLLLSDGILACASFDDFQLFISDAPRELVTRKIREAFSKRVGLKLPANTTNRSNEGQGGGVISREQQLLRDRGKSKALAQVSVLLSHRGSNTADLLASLEQLLGYYGMDPKLVTIKCEPVEVDHVGCGSGVHRSQTQQQAKAHRNAKLNRSQTQHETKTSWNSPLTRSKTQNQKNLENVQVNDIVHSSSSILENIGTVANNQSTDNKQTPDKQVKLQTASPLISMAAKNWYPRVVEVLLRKGCSVTQRDTACGGFTPLMSCIASMLSISRLEANLDPALERRLVYTVRTMLQHVKRDDELARLLKAQSMQSVFLPCGDGGVVNVPSGSTALHLAVLCSVHPKSSIFGFGHPMLIEILLRVGAKRDIADANGDVPADLLHRYREFGSFPSVSTVLAGEFDTTSKKWSTKIVAAAKHGSVSAMQECLAIVRSHDPQYRWILYSTHRADSITSNGGGRLQRDQSTLDVKSSQSSRKPTLLRSPSSPKLGSRDDVGVEVRQVSNHQTVMGIACRSGSWEIVQLLYCIGVSVLVGGPCRQDPLLVARVGLGNAVNRLRQEKVETANSLSMQTKDKPNLNLSKVVEGKQMETKNQTNANAQTKKAGLLKSDTSEERSKKDKSPKANSSTKKESPKDSTDVKDKGATEKTESEDATTQVQMFHNVVNLLEKEYHNIARTCTIPFRSYCSNRLGKSLAKE